MGGLEGFQRSGRRGPAPQELSAAWAEKEDSGSEMQGEVEERLPAALHVYILG